MILLMLSTDWREQRIGAASISDERDDERDRHSHRRSEKNKRDKVIDCHVCIV